MSYAREKARVLSAFNKAYFSHLIEKNGGNISAAAREAELDRANFRRMLRRYHEPYTAGLTRGATGLTPRE